MICASVVPQRYTMVVFILVLVFAWRSLDEKLYEHPVWKRAAAWVNMWGLHVMRLVQYRSKSWCNKRQWGLRMFQLIFIIFSPCFVFTEHYRRLNQSKLLLIRNGMFPFSNYSTCLVNKKNAVKIWPVCLKKKSLLGHLWAFDANRHATHWFLFLHLSLRFRIHKHWGLSPC